MAFEFIDNSAIDPRSRKLIRSHVMKGKNTGRILSRPAKKKASRKRATPTLLLPDSEPVVVSPASNGASSVVERDPESNAMTTIPSAIGNGFSTVRMPVEPGPFARSRLSQFFRLIDGSHYPAEFCYQRHHASSLWFQYALMDAAFLHCTIAISTTFIDYFLGKKQPLTVETPPESLMHISEAFRLMNQRLAGSEALSNHTMASVVSLSLHEQLSRDYAKGRIHLEGLMKIVKLRGGLLQLPQELAHKICRCDMDVALHDGASPKLQYPGISGDCFHAIFGSRRKHTRLADLQFADPDPVLEGIALDISTFTNFLDSDAKPYKLVPCTYQAIVIDLSYRLLEHRPLSRFSTIETVQEAMHLALTAFMTTFVLTFGFQRRIRFTFLSDRLQAALHAPWAYERDNQPFLLWALVVGGITCFGASDHIWLLHRIRATANSMGIHHWETLRTALLQFPWVKAAHEDLTRELWSLALSI